MNGDSDARLRYQPVWCQFLGQRVWAIVTRQSDGTWRIVNCLDKDQECFRLDCAFTADRGTWPYPDTLCTQEIKRSHEHHG